jgi:hypothetical protein
MVTRDVIADCGVDSPASTSFSFTTMGLLLSLPIAGPLGAIASSCLAGLAFCCTSTAGKLLLIKT